MKYGKGNSLKNIPSLRELGKCQWKIKTVDYAIVARALYGKKKW